MNKFRHRLNLQLFAEESATGVEGAGEAALQTEQPQNAEVETGVDTNPEAGGDEKAPDANTAWEKRIATIKQKAEQETRAQLEKEYSEKYKDYDTYKDVAEYFRESNQLPDVMTLKERVEMERLQERAEQQNVPPEVIQRLDQLEAKAAKADEYEQQQQQTQELQTFRASLEKFAEGKDVKADDLHKYMFDNQIGNVEVAFKAMRADQLEQQLQQKETDVINKYLQSKTAPRVEGAGTPGVVDFDPAKADFKELRARTIARINAANNPT